MSNEQIKSEHLRRNFMMNIHELVDKCRPATLAIDFDVTKRELLTRYLIQELNPENIYLIVKAEHNGPEIDMGSIRSICPEINCEHLFIINSYNKATILQQLHDKTAKEVVLLSEYDKPSLIDELDLRYVKYISLLDLLP